MRVGVLALQGDFRKHQERLADLGARPLLVRNVQDLQSVSALVIPGGESTVFLRLADDGLKEALRHAIRDGLPTLATCAGVILLARKVENPAQESLQVLDVVVRRNAYGRQLDSFITSSVQWTEKGRDSVRGLVESTTSLPTLECVFIRAPRIVQSGGETDILLTYNDDPVLVRQNNIYAATFHPELSDSAGAQILHQFILQRVH